MGRFALSGADRNVHSPCLDCERRFVGCHSTCEDYKAFRDKLDKAKEVIAQKKREEDIAVSFKIQSVQKQIRKKGQKT